MFFNFDIRYYFSDIKYYNDFEVIKVLNIIYNDNRYIYVDIIFLIKLVWFLYLLI